MTSISKYRPDIDGLRAVAVTLVLLFHADLGLRGGFIGVDIFFVISGFLITRLVWGELESGQFNLAEFWVRRIRRILPPCLVVVFATLIAGFPVFLPNDYSELAKASVTHQMMLSNVFFWRHAGYFSGNAELKPLLHTWSLAVEEQFYVGYPLLLLLLRRTSRRTVIATLVALAAISLGISEYCVHRYASAAFYLLPTRAWELLTGGLLCFAPPPSGLSRRVLGILGGIACLGIASSAVLFTSTTRFPGVAAILPCASAALLIYSNSSQLTPVGSLMAARPLVLVGLISYSLYLWHWPALSFLRYLYAGVKPEAPARIGALAVGLGLAYLSYRFVEVPIRRKDVLPTTRSLLQGMVAGCALVMAGAVAIIVLAGIPERLDPRAIAYTVAKTTRQYATQLKSDVSLERAVSGQLPLVGVLGGSVRCILWGDSHARALVPGLDAAARGFGIQIYQATHSATPPILNFKSSRKPILSEQWPPFNRAIFNFARSNQINLAILAAAWPSYADQPGFEQHLTETVVGLQQAGLRVVIVLDVARQNGEVPLVLSMAVRRGKDVTRIGIPRSQYLSDNARCNEVIRRLGMKGVEVLDLAPFFVDSAGLWRAEMGGESLYLDTSHLSVEGSLRLQPLFKELFTSLGKR